MEPGTPKAAGETLLDGKLEVVRVLGTGGMGTVYEVRHTLTKHHRALKVLHPREANATIIKRFLQEASVAGTLGARDGGSDYIVETFDAGQLEDGSFYVLMELLEGEPLRNYVGRVDTVDIGVACAIVEELCRGLKLAHDAGIVHRDLKPDNVFLVDTPAGVKVKLLDFGISKFQSDQTVTGATKTGAILGTPHYMSPEQLKNSKDVDARTDIYSVGVMLYEMLAGRRPFEAESLPSLLVKIYSGERDPLLTHAQHVPAKLADVVERTLSLDASARPASAVELGHAIAPFASTIELSPREPAPSTEEIAFLPTATPEDAPTVPQTRQATMTQPTPSSTSTEPNARWPAWFAATLVLVVLGGLAVWSFRSSSTDGPERESGPNATTMTTTMMTTSTTMTALPLGMELPTEEPEIDASTPVVLEMDMGTPSMRDLKMSPYGRMQ